MANTSTASMNQERQPQPMLQQGDSVPHFEVTTIRGEQVRYSSLWQHRNLVLFTFPAVEAELTRRFIAQLTARTSEFTARDAECVMTRDPVEGIPAPGVLVADRWGDIAHIATASEVDALTSPEELLKWLEYLNHRCPECEGEAR